MVGRAELGVGLVSIPSHDLPWLYELETCPSTNTWALAQMQQLPHGAVVFTRRQTQGRGQQGRSWSAPPGVVTASFVLKGLSTLAGLSLAAGLAVIYAVEDLLPNCRNQLKLKWPNDVLVNRRKLAGILCEAASGPQLAQKLAQKSVVVGIGLNRWVNFAAMATEPTSPFSELSNRAISLHQLTRSVPDELILLGQLRHYLLQVADLFSESDRATSPVQKRPLGLEVLLPALRERDVLLHNRIRLTLPQKTLVGTAAGIDPVGQLLLQTDDGLRACSAGRVDWGDGGNGDVIARNTLF